MAGKPFAVQPVVDEEDMYHNLETGDVTTTVVAAIQSGAGPLVGTTAVTLSGGVATFTNLVDDRAATITLSFSASQSGVGSATSNGIAVSPAASSKLVFGQAPTDVVAGAPLSPPVTLILEDTYSNPVTTDNSSLTLTLSSGNFAGGGNTITAAASAGVATFAGLTIDAAGTYTLAVRGGSLTLSDGSDSFTVTPAAASSLVINAEPPSALTAGAAFGLEVGVVDAYANTVTTYSGTAAVALATAVNGAALGGDLSEPFVNGVATFTSLTLDVAGGAYTVQATSAALPAASTSDISVSPAAAAKVVVSAQPPSAVIAGTSFAVVVEVDDQFGNVATSYGGSLGVALAADPGGPDPLGGPLTTTAVDGVATFSGLTLDTSARRLSAHDCRPGSCGQRVRSLHGQAGGSQSACHHGPAAAQRRPRRRISVRRRGRRPVRECGDRRERFGDRDDREHDGRAGRRFRDRAARERDRQLRGFERQSSGKLCARVRRRWLGRRGVSAVCRERADHDHRRANDHKW